MSIKYKTYILSLLTLSAVTLILVSLSTTYLETFASLQEQQIGMFGNLIGKVELTRATKSSSVMAKEGLALLPGDIVITHTDSKAQFLFRPSFWLMPHSKMEFVKTQRGIEGRLIYGEIKKTDSNKSFSAQNITLFFENTPIILEHFSSYKDVSLNNFEPIQVNPDFDELSQEKTKPNNLVEQQIFQTLSLHKRFFQSCLIRHYKKNKGQLRGGETVFSMMIQPNGEIEKIRITKSETNNSEYEECLTDVLARVHFKNLKIDEPLPAVFPLNIEL